jgi:hypothetical protein
MIIDHSETHGLICLRPVLFPDFCWGDCAFGCAIGNDFESFSIYVLSSNMLHRACFIMLRRNLQAGTRNPLDNPSDHPTIYPAWEPFPSINMTTS